MSSLALRPVSRQSTVLLVCDVQERFRSLIYGFDSMTAGVRKMVKAAKVLDIPVITTEQNPKAFGVTAPEVGLAELPDNLMFGPFSKTKFSMFVPSVEEILRQKSIESAVLVGIESHVCVLQTALDLLRAGISVYVLADAVSSCNKQEVPLALDYIRNAGGVVTTTESIMFQLMHDASEPPFKPFLKVITEEKEPTAKALAELVERGTKI